MGLQAPNAGKTQDYLASPLQVRGGTGVPPMLNGPVRALAEFDSKLHVGGSFSAVGGIVANRIATWDGAAWGNLIDNGVNGVGDVSTSRVSALHPTVGVLAAGGRFRTAGDEASVGNVATWNGTTWTVLDGGVSSNVFALGGPAGGIDIVAGGRFLSAISDDENLNRYANWVGGSWDAEDGGFSHDVAAVTFFGGKAVAGGAFQHGGDPRIPLSLVCELNGGKWQEMGDGLVGGAVSSLHEHGGLLYAGGPFQSLGRGGEARGIASWDGAQWDKLVGGQLEPVGSALAMTTFDGDLIMGGRLSHAGGLLVNNIAAHDGVAYSALGAGLNGLVFALAKFGGDLYAGGNFTSSGSGADRVVCPYIAKWDGNEWSAVA